MTIPGHSASDIIEAQWQAQVNDLAPSKSCCAPLLTICGPSGVGKTTVVSALAAHYSAYIETTNGNPHLGTLLDGRGDFDAAANQKWFLDRIHKHIAQAASRLPLVLDQDPAAIVLAYSRLFREDGRITDGQYSSLLKRLLRTEDALKHWRKPRAIIFLDAPADVLRKRVVQRGGESRTPPLAWFDQVRTLFLQLHESLPNTTLISSVESSVEEVVSRARMILEKPEDDAHA